MAKVIVTDLDGLYDNGGKTFDRYTALYTSRLYDPETGEYDDQNESYWYRGMSDNPFHPQGFGQAGEGAAVNDEDDEIELADAPEDVQRCIAMDLEDEPADQ
jgi:hypothetical protein